MNAIPIASEQHLLNLASMKKYRALKKARRQMPQKVNSTVIFETTGHSGAEEWKRDTGGSNAKWVTSQTVRMQPRRSAPSKPQPTVAQLLSDPILRSKREAEALEQAQRDGLVEDEKPTAMGADAISELLKNPALPAEERARATKLLALMGQAPPAVDPPPLDKFDPPAVLPPLPPKQPPPPPPGPGKTLLKGAPIQKKKGKKAEPKKTDHLDDAKKTQKMLEDANKALKKGEKLYSTFDEERFKKAEETLLKIREAKEIAKQLRAEKKAKAEAEAKEEAAKNASATNISRVARGLIARKEVRELKKAPPLGGPKDKPTDAEASTSTAPAVPSTPKPSAIFKTTDKEKLALYNSLSVETRDILELSSKGNTEANGGLSAANLIATLGLPKGTLRYNAEAYAKKVLSIGSKTPTKYT